jgi:hypothetical protein
VKLNTLFVAAAVASAFLVGTSAYADGTVQPPSDSASGRAVYQGTDRLGRVVQLTINDIGVPTLVRISPASDSARYPELHWSSQIGTGQAASLEH